MASTNIAIVGFGKIAQDSHVPAIGSRKDLRLTAAVSPRPIADSDIRWFSSHRDMLAQMTDLKAVAICTPPSVRYQIAQDCLAAGLHVLLEKPPTSTVGEIQALSALARERRLTLFTAWHTRFNRAVEAAREIVARESLASFSIHWLENVAKWHPGQEWIWRPGGFGVFDAGINAISLVTHVCPALTVREAELVYRDDHQTPIAASLSFDSPGVPGPLEAVFDWRHEGREAWTIDFVTGGGSRLTLAEGGATLLREGSRIAISAGDEYASLYACFERLMSKHSSLVEIESLSLVADAFLIGRRSPLG